MAQYSRKLAKGIKWWYKFDYSGTTYSSQAVYDTKKLAREAETDKFKEVSTLKQNPSEKAEFSLLEVMTKRLEELKVKKTLSYYKMNEAHFKLFLAYINDINGITQIDKDLVNVVTVTKLQVKEFLLKQASGLKKRGKDNYTANAMIRSLRALFNFAIDTLEIEMNNPCRKLQEFSVNMKLKYIPPDSYIDAVKALCNPERLLLMEFVGETACRINEALRLTGKDVLENHIVFYTRKSKNSNLVPRMVERPPCLKGKTFKSDERVFPTWKAQPKFLHDLIEKLGQPEWGFHNLRHRRASIWNKQKDTAFDIMLKLGHSSLKTTQRYLQKLP